MSITNEIVITMPSKSQNESFARIAAAAFVSVFDPTVNEINEIKTAVSEAVTNAIIHGYDGNDGKITMTFSVNENALSTEHEIIIEVMDDGVGIGDIDEARLPLFTSKPEMERSGMGFTVMESFMDEVSILSQKGKGTHVIMKKKLSR